MSDSFILQGTITADNKQAISSMKEVESQGQRTDSNLNRSFLSIANGVGSAMTKVGTAMMGASAVVGGTALTMFVPFEEKVQQVSTLVSKEFEPRISSDMKRLSNILGKNATDIGEAMYQGLSASVSEENIADFTLKMGKLAKGGFTEIATATDIATTVLNAYGLEISEVDRISDVLINTQNKGKTTVDELASAMGKVIPTASSMGIEFEQIASSLSISTAKGISTAESVTYLNSMLNELNKTSTGVGKWMSETLGVTFQDLQNEGMNLGEILAFIDEEAKNNGESFDQLWSSAEGGKMALTLLSEEGADFTSMMESMKNSTGETEKAFGKMEDTLKSKIEKSVQKVKNSFISLAEVMLPVIEEKVLPLIDKFATWIGNLDEEALQNIFTWTQWGVSLGSLLLIGGKFLTFGTSLVSSLGKIGQGLGTATTSTSAFSTGLGMIGKILSPTGLVIGGIALLTGVIMNNEKQIREGEKAFKDMGEGMDDFSGKLRTNESIWSTLFGKKYEWKMSEQFHEQKQGIDSDSQEIINIVQGTHDQIETILNTDISTEEKQAQIREAYNKEVEELTNKWNQYHSIDDSNQSQNISKYMQYLNELGVEDYGFRSQQIALYNEYFDTQQLQMSDNEAKILEIKRIAMEQGRNLTIEEQDSINAIIEENSAIRTTLTDMEGKDIWQILDKWNVEKKAIYGKDSANHTQHELEKRKATEEYVKARKEALEEEIQVLNQRSDVDRDVKSKMLQNLSEQEVAVDVAKNNFTDSMRSMMESGMSYEESLSKTLDDVNRMFDENGVQARTLGTTNERVWSEIVSAMMEGKASTEDLTKAFMNIPLDIRPKVMTTVEGKWAVDDLKASIDRIQSKDVYINTYTNKFGDGSAFARGTEGVMPKRAYGDEFFKSTQTALVGEQGAEIVELPRGAKVKTHRETRNIMNNGEGSQPVQVSIELDGRTIATALAKYVGEAVGDNNRRLSYGGAW